MNKAAKRVVVSSSVAGTSAAFVSSLLFGIEEINSVLAIIVVVIAAATATAIVVGVTSMFESVKPKPTSKRHSIEKKDDDSFRE